MNMICWMCGGTSATGQVNSHNLLEKMQLNNLEIILHTGDGWLKKVKKLTPRGSRGCGFPKETWSEMNHLYCIVLGLTKTHDSDRKALSGALRGAIRLDRTPTLRTNYVQYSCIHYTRMMMIMMMMMMMMVWNITSTTGFLCLGAPRLSQWLLMPVHHMLNVNEGDLVDLRAPLVYTLKTPWLFHWMQVLSGHHFILSNHLWSSKWSSICGQASLSRFIFCAMLLNQHMSVCKVQRLHWCPLGHTGRTNTCPQADQENQARVTQIQIKKSVTENKQVKIKDNCYNRKKTKTKETLKIKHNYSFAKINNKRNAKRSPHEKKQGAHSSSC